MESMLTYAFWIIIGLIACLCFIALLQGKRSPCEDCHDDVVCGSCEYFDKVVMPK